MKVARCVYRFRLHVKVIFIFKWKGLLKKYEKCEHFKDIYLTEMPKIAHFSVITYDAFESWHLYYFNQKKSEKKTRIH